MYVVLQFNYDLFAKKIIVKLQNHSISSVWVRVRVRKLELQRLVTPRIVCRSARFWCQKLI